MWSVGGKARTCLGECFGVGSAGRTRQTWCGSDDEAAVEAAAVEAAAAAVVLPSCFAEPEKANRAQTDAWLRLEVETSEDPADGGGRKMHPRPVLVPREEHGKGAGLEEGEKEVEEEDKAGHMNLQCGTERSPFLARGCRNNFPH